MIAGDTDSGKTSTAIQAMKAAQDKGIQVFYAETENKTNTSDFVKWGVDPDKVLVIQETIAEHLYQSLFTYIRGFKESFPGKELLVIVDSMGNVVSQRSQDMDLTEESDKPGEKGKINRQMLEILISLVRDKSSDVRIATLLINYTYDNIGYAKGKTAAGGKGPMQFSSLVYQTQRKGTEYETTKGVDTKSAAVVLWTLIKNHIYKDKPGAHKVTIEIDSAGMRVTEKA
jgi:RecA/RadA recombinase